MALIKVTNKGVICLIPNAADNLVEEVMGINRERQ